MPADFYVMVSYVYTKPEAYILTANEVSDNLTQYESVYWLQIKGSRKESEEKGFSYDKFKEKWSKIGYGRVNYSDERRYGSIVSNLHLLV